MGLKGSIIFIVTLMLSGCGGGGSGSGSGSGYGTSSSGDIDSAGKYCVGENTTMLEGVWKNQCAPVIVTSGGIDFIVGNQEITNTYCRGGFVTKTEQFNDSSCTQSIGSTVFKAGFTIGNEITAVSGLSAYEISVTPVDTIITVVGGGGSRCS